ncbi:MAG: DinB family protein [Planctomycetota bacterium]|nr:DinB family protein [Planctomycetota bacterium]
MDRKLIDWFEAGGPTLRRSVHGLSSADLDALPVPGTWSIRQIVVHLFDSDLIAVHRFRRVVAENKPLLIAYDETAASQKLGYEHDDIELVLTLFERLRSFTAAWLRRLPDDAFLREGVHNHRGLVTLGAFVKIYAEHVDHHLAFVRQKRELLGNPLKA